MGPWVRGSVGPWVCGLVVIESKSVKACIWDTILRLCLSICVGLGEWVWNGVMRLCPAVRNDVVSTQAYKRLCPSVGPSVCPLVHPSVHPSVVIELKNEKNERLSYF